MAKIQQIYFGGNDEYYHLKFNYTVAIILMAELSQGNQSVCVYMDVLLSFHSRHYQGKVTSETLVHKTLISHFSI